MATHERAVWGGQGGNLISASRTSIPTEMVKSAAKKCRLSVCSIGSTAMEMASLTKKKHNLPRSGCATGGAKGPGRRIVSPDHSVPNGRPMGELDVAGAMEFCWTVSCWSQFILMLAPWVNEIGRLHRTSEAIADPHELASWVNEIGRLHRTSDSVCRPP